MAFDPHSLQSAAAAAGRSSVTRLELSSYVGGANSSAPGAAFAPLVVRNLAGPIYFTLPAPSTMQSAALAAPEVAGQQKSQAVCSFYDKAAGAYAGAGCVAQPAPAPAGLSAVWVRNFSAAKSADMARAWTFSAADWAAPPLLGCREVFIDCGNASQARPGA